mgnify:CR=1 FL=1
MKRTKRFFKMTASNLKGIKHIFLMLLVLFSVHAFSQQDKKPNVLFIAIDDLNDWTTLFDKDNPIQTPNLERLARRGMFFTKACWITNRILRMPCCMVISTGM